MVELVIFTFQKKNTAKKTEDLHLSDFWTNVMQKMQWIHLMEECMMVGNLGCKWQNMTEMRVEETRDGEEVDHDLSLGPGVAEDLDPEVIQDLEEDPDLEEQGLTHGILISREADLDVGQEAKMRGEHGLSQVQDPDQSPDHVIEKVAWIA